MQELTRPSFRRNARERRGSVLVVALLAVMIGAGMVVGLMQMGIAFNREYATRLDQERAYALAEAGLDEALVAMRRGGTGVIGSVSEPARLGGGLLWTTVTDVGSDLRLVVSAGAVGTGRVALARPIFHYSVDGYDTAIFADQDLVLAANVLVDSFHSGLGPYEEQLAESPGPFVGDAAALQSNGEVTLEAATAVYGDVHPGLGDVLVAASNTVIQGSQESLAEERQLPPVEVPPIPLGGTFLVSGAVTLPAGDHGFADIVVQHRSSLTIQGPSRVVLGDWIVDSNTTVVLDTTNGPIEVYALGDLDWHSKAKVVTTDRAASRVSLYLAGGPDQEAHLRSNSEFYGRIYGPQARVKIRSNFELFGAVLARDVVLKSNVAIHYDEALRSLVSEVKFVPGATSPAPFPQRSLRVKRGDPFQVLGLDPDTLPTPEGAHHESP